MIINGFVTCILIGDNFDLSEFESKSVLSLINILRKGDIGKSGKYKGINIPYSSAEINLEECDNSLDEEFNGKLALLVENHKLIEESGVSDIFLTLNLKYSDQCNWEFNPMQINALASLGISISISCYDG